jgi:hypothetical protein
MSAQQYIQQDIKKAERERALQGAYLTKKAETPLSHG